MYFINDKGEIEQGTPLTEEQFAQREQIRAFIHETICGGGKHYDFQRRTEKIHCEIIANFFASKFTISPQPGVNLQQAIAAAAAENVPFIEEPAPQPVSPIEPPESIEVF